MVKYFQEIKHFQNEYHMIILEWGKSTTEEVYLLTKNKKLLSVRKTISDFDLDIGEQGNGVCLVTLSFSDKNNKYRYIGDAYWSAKKNRYVALLWSYGNSGMILPRRKKSLLS